METNMYEWMYSLRTIFYIFQLHLLRSINTMGWVVQRPISANPGLKVNLLFCFYIFLESVYFQASQNKTFINSYQVSENKIPTLLSGCSEFCSVVFYYSRFKLIVFWINAARCWRCQELWHPFQMKFRIIIPWS